MQFPKREDTTFLRICDLFVNNSIFKVKKVSIFFIPLILIYLRF